MSVNIESRQNELTYLQNYLKDVDTEVTMILQNLQWDRKHLGERRTMAICQYDLNHRVPPDKLAEHEKGCLLKSQGYNERDSFLPSPIDPDAATLVKLNADNIADIIKKASNFQALKPGVGCGGQQPLTLERLQATYTAEQRRAIHDAVVDRVPSCHDLSDLALLSAQGVTGKTSVAKTKLEILAELRNMRRRRAKYRVAAKTRNYSDVLRDVITTQMELYTQAQDNSVNQMHVKSSDSDSNTLVLKQDDSRPKEKPTTSYRDITPSRSYHSNEGQSSSSTKDKYNESRHSKYHEGYESRKRRHDHAYNPAKYSKTQECDGSASSRTDQYKDNMNNSKSKRTYGEYVDSPEVSKERHKHYDYYKSRKSQHGDKDYDDYESKKRQRGEKEYDYRKKSRSDNYTSNAPIHTTKDTRNDGSKSEKKFHSYYSHREHEDQYGNRKLSHKSKDTTDRHRYGYNKNQDHTLK